MPSKLAEISRLATPYVSVDAPAIVTGKQTLFVVVFQNQILLQLAHSNKFLDQVSEVAAFFCAVTMIAVKDAVLVRVLLVQGSTLMAVDENIPCL